MPVLSTRIVLDCFYLLIFYLEKFSTDVCRLPYAVNVNLNLSNFPYSTHKCERPNVAGLVDNQATAIYPQGSELNKKMSHIQFV